MTSAEISREQAELSAVADADHALLAKHPPVDVLGDIIARSARRSDRRVELMVESAKNVPEELNRIIGEISAVVEEHGNRAVEITQDHTDADTDNF